MIQTDATPPSFLIVNAQFATHRLIDLYLATRKLQELQLETRKLLGLHFTDMQLADCVLESLIY